jgi:O-acetyl-ADP-ribose deacetylase (regulator of RNase III)
MLELDRIRPAGGCPTGSAVATHAGNLPAKHVFHAVGPVWQGGGKGEPELLASCYRTCVAMAEERAAKIVSFPSISTGIYGYPVDKAACVALDALRDYFTSTPHTVIDEVVFVLFDDRTFQAYSSALQAGTRSGSSL